MRVPSVNDNDRLDVTSPQTIYQNIAPNQPVSQMGQTKFRNGVRSTAPQTVASLGLLGAGTQYGEKF